MIADNISTIAAMLQNGSALTGAINAAQTVKVVNLTLEARQHLERHSGFDADVSG